MIQNFKLNLTPDNLEEFNIDIQDVKKIENTFKSLFQQCEKEENISRKTYYSFREKLSTINPNLKLLDEVEKVLEFDECEKKIAKFSKEIQSLGKDIRIQVESDSIQISFE